MLCGRAWGLVIEVGGRNRGERGAENGEAEGSGGRVKKTISGQWGVVYGLRGVYVPSTVSETV